MEPAGTWQELATSIRKALNLTSQLRAGIPNILFRRFVSATAQWLASSSRPDRLPLFDRTELREYLKDADAKGKLGKNRRSAPLEPSKGRSTESLSDAGTSEPDHGRRAPTRDDQIDNAVTSALQTLTARLRKLPGAKKDLAHDCVLVTCDVTSSDRILTLELTGLLQKNRCDSGFPYDPRVGLLARITKEKSRRSSATVKPRLSLTDLLTAWEAGPIDELADPALIAKLNPRFVLRNILVDATFGSRHGGIDASRIVLRPASDDRPALPAYVYETRAALPVPPSNHVKAYLEEWTPQVLDQNVGVTLYVGSRDSNVASGHFDYLTTQAIVKSADRIQDDIRAGRVAIESLARPLFHAIVVVTADDKLLLARRGNKKVVDALAGHWMTSIGESVDGEKDRDPAGVPSPMLAVRRCLVESDELNLPRQALDCARATYLGLATPWGWMSAALLVLVELRVDLHYVLDWVTRGEHDKFAGIDFSPTTCLPLIRAGTFVSSEGGEPEPLVPLSSAALLLSLFSRFGYDEIRAEIEASL